MATITTNFTATGNSLEMLLKPGDSLTYTGSGTYAATFHVEWSNNGGQTWNIVRSNSTANATVTDTVKNDTGSAQNYRFRCSAYTSGTLATTLVESTSEVLFSVKNKSGQDVLVVDESGVTVTGAQTVSGAQTFASLVTLQANADITAAATDAVIGVVNAPVSGTTAVTFERVGPFFRLNFTLTAAQIPVTDGAGSGSHGSLKLMDMTAGGIVYLGCRQNYTAYVPDGTGVPDDAVFEIGVGTVAIAAAADGTLGATNDDIGADIDQTLVAGTTTGTAHTASSVAFDGTSTAADILLNWSGTAATIDGNGTIDVTGTISIVGMLLGDD